MLEYSLIMFAVTVLFLGLGIAIYRGNTKLIHDYHQTKVKESERLDYARDFSKGMFVICAGTAVSGIIALFGQSGRIVLISIAALAAGLIAGMAVLFRVQKRYNGGMF